MNLLKKENQILINLDCVFGIEKEDVIDYNNLDEEYEEYNIIFHSSFGKQLRHYYGKEKELRDTAYNELLNIS